MAIEFVCPTCQHTLRVGDESTGKVVRCGSCMTTLRVPAAIAKPAPPPPSAIPEAEEVFDVQPAASAGPPKPSPIVKGSVKGVTARPASAPRPRPDRAPEKPRGRGLVLLLVILLVGLFVGAIGGAAYYLMTPKWRPHESLAGGFKVELPAPPRDDVANDPAAKRAGVIMAAEGTLLRLRSEEYVVMYVEIPLDRRMATTDDQLIADALDNVKAEQPDVFFGRNDPVVVSGFPGRELECTSSKLGAALLRIVIAETRAYIVIAGGRGADPNNERFRRFIDSFEVTDPRLFAQAKARKDAANRVEENRRRMREDAERRQKEIDDRMAAERKQVEDKLRAEEKRRADAEQARKDEDARIRRDAEAFRTAKWTGPAIPDPNSIPTLKLYLPFDGGTGKEATLQPSGSSVPTAEHATTGAGVRGDALYLARDTRGFTVLADKVPDALKRNRSVTITAWVKVRGKSEVVPALTEMNQGAVFGMRFGSIHSRLSVPTSPPYNPNPETFAAWTPDEEWHHVAVVRYLLGDGQRFIYTLYIDGSEARVAQGIGGNAVTDVRGLRIAAAAEPEFSRPPAEAQVRRELPIAAIDELCVFDDALSPRAVAYLAGKVNDVPRDQALMPPPPAPAPAPRPVAPRYAGRPAVPPSELANLRYHLSCDALDGGRLTESVSGGPVGVFASQPRLVDGVRGRAVRILANPAHPKDRVVGLSLDAAKLRVDPSKPFTMSFWARRVESPADRSLPPEKLFLVAAQSDPKLIGRRTFAVSHAGGTATARFGETSIQSERGTGGSAFVSHKEVAPFGWNHYAVTRDEKNRLWLWVNGETTWIDPRPATVWPLWYDDFGLCVAGHDEFGLGVIPPGPAALDLDEFALFDRALTEDEIVRLAGSPNVAGRPAAHSPDPSPSLHNAVIKPGPKYAGGAVPPATDFKGLTYYIPFGDLKDGAVKEVVAGKSVGSNKRSEPLDDGPRGKASRLVAGSRGSGSAAITLTHAPPEVKFGMPFTMAVWVRAADGSAASLTFDVIRSRDRTGNRLTVFSLQRLLNEYAVLGGDGFPTIEQSLKPTAIQKFPKGEWTHLSVSRTDKGEVRWTINGQACSQAPPPFPYALKFDDLSLGWGQAGPFILDLAEFCVFDRVLADDEIVKLAGSPKVTPETTLVAPPKLPVAVVPTPVVPPKTVVPKFPEPKPAPKFTLTVPPATDFKGLTYYLACDETDGKTVKEAVSGKSVGTLLDGATLADGVRGKALRLVYDGSKGAPDKAALMLDGAALKFSAGKPFTLAYWARKTVREPTTRVVQVVTGRGDAKFLTTTLSGTRAMATQTDMRPAAPRVIPFTHSTQVDDAMEWTHCALVRDDKNRVVWYVNGKPDVGDREFPGDVTFDAINLVRTASRTAVASIDLDEFCVFDRNLDRDEIAKLAGRPKPDGAASPKPAEPAPSPAPKPAAVAPPKPADGPVPPATDFKGLTFYLALDETDGTAVKEAMTGKLVGTLAKGAELITGARGKALRFTAENTTGPGLTLDPSALAVAEGKPFTISYWARKGASEPAIMTPTVILGKAARGNFNLITSLHASHSVFVMREQTGQMGGVAAVSLSSSFAANGWNHFAAVRNESNAVRWYVNGTPHAAMPKCDARINLSSLSLVDAPPANKPITVRVDLDEFAVFDRALSEDELKKLAGKGK